MFTGSPGVSIPNRTSIRLAVFAQTARVTDKLTDRHPDHRSHLVHSTRSKKCVVCHTRWGTVRLHNVANLDFNQTNIVGRTTSVCLHRSELPRGAADSDSEVCEMTLI